MSMVIQQGAPVKHTLPEQDKIDNARVEKT